MYQTSNYNGTLIKIVPQHESNRSIYLLNAVIPGTGLIIILIEEYDNVQLYVIQL